MLKKLKIHVIKGKLRAEPSDWSCKDPGDHLMQESWAGMKGRHKRKGIHVYLGRIHVVKPTQHLKQLSSNFKKRQEKKKNLMFSSLFLAATFDLWA